MREPWMQDRKLAKEIVIDFTRRALGLADEIGDDLAAVHLQTALDTLTGAPVPRTLEEAEAMLQLPEDAGNHGAMGEGAAQMTRWRVR